jgi:prepilin-type N-terminal cleavage/methylation domain-containing protein
MIKSRTNFSKKARGGFTLIELLVVIAISGLLGSGVITAMYQLSTVNKIDNARMLAVKQVENALYFINRDMQMAQKVEANGADYRLRVSRSDWDTNILTVITYSLDEGTLVRSISVNGGEPVTSIAANYITTLSAEAPDSQSQPPEKAWTILITATASSGNKQLSETRQVQIIPRPGS